MKASKSPEHPRALTRLPKILRQCLTRSTRRQTSPRASMHRVLSPCASAHRVLSSRASTRQICTADVNRRWRHHWHVTCWHHRPHLLMSPATLADVIIDKLLTCVDFDRWLWLRVDFDRWLFARVDFCNPGAPYPVFRVDFIFAVYFFIFCF